MCRHSVMLLISLSVGFLDSLHDPSAYVAPHDIPDVAIQVYKHTLTPPPPPRILSESPIVPYVEFQNCLMGHSILSASVGFKWAIPVLWSIQGPGSVADSSLGNQVPATEIPQVVAVCFLWRTHICRARHSMRVGMSAVLLKPMLIGTHISWSTILGE